MGNTKYINDFEQSKALFEKYKKVVKPQMCYNNIFHVASNEIQRLKNNNLKIAYGFISVDEDEMLYARHCFLLDGNTVIDPTIIANHEGVEQHRDYLVFKVFDSFKEYFDAIENERGHYPALDSTLRRIDLEFRKEQQKNHKFFIS